MPTIKEVKIRGFRVMIHTNDHLPINVHVIGADCEAVFNLHGPDGPVELRENYDCKRPQLKRIKAGLNDHLASYAQHGSVSMDQFQKEIAQATKRAEERLKHNPRAIAAQYDRDQGRVVIELSNGSSFAFPPNETQGLANAQPDDLSEIEITPSGYGLHWPKLDEDLWLPTLLEGVFGSRAWMAARLGAQGGKVTSDAKAAAARENGKRGGRPRNAPVSWPMEWRPATGLRAFTRHASKPPVHVVPKAATASARKVAREPARAHVGMPPTAKVKSKGGSTKGLTKKSASARLRRRKAVARKRAQPKTKRA